MLTPRRCPPEDRPALHPTLAFGMGLTLVSFAVMAANLRVAGLVIILTGVGITFALGGYRPGFSALVWTSTSALPTPP